VLPGKVMAADVAGQVLNPTTAGGATVHVDGTDGVTVDGAKVVTADIDCTNAVIHVIDTVLLPKG
ncbi:Nex18 symbiotically induced protein, partial [Pseudomonas sp. GW247-3R2A]